MQSAKNHNRLLKTLN